MTVPSSVTSTTVAPPTGAALTPEQRFKLLQPLSFPHPLAILWIMIFVALVAWSIVGVEINPQKLQRFWPNIIRFVGSLWPPDNTYWLQLVDPILATIQMAFLGTLLSVVLSIPFALVAARNTSPHPVAYQVSRMILNMIRAVPSLVWAIIFVAAMGFGPFAGVIALGVGQVGVLGKLYSEAIEAINPRQVEAIRATGAGVLQVFSFAVLPQALPLMISYTLLDFESNIRSATILGIVGAGGIGFELQASFSQFRFHQVLTILIEIVILVTVIDQLSAFVRRRLI
jgi:phosphonate transport system permease protein